MPEPRLPFRPKYRSQQSKLNPKTEARSLDINPRSGERELVEAMSHCYEAWNARRAARHQALLRLDGHLREDELDDEQRAEYRRRAEAITRDDDPVARVIDDVIHALKSIEDVMRQEERRQAEKAA